MPLNSSARVDQTTTPRSTGAHEGKLRLAVSSIKGVDPDLVARARTRMDNLTKPVGSMGRLEQVAVQVAAIQGTDRPVLSRKRLIVCIGDHGVVNQGVAAYPSEVTRTMAEVIGQSLSAVCQLALAADAEVAAYDVGMAGSAEPIHGVSGVRVASGTQDMTLGPAMSREEACLAMLVGIDAATEAVQSGVSILAIGEMGIGNSTPAAALTAAYTGAAVDACVGSGAGADAHQLARKVTAVSTALEANRIDTLDSIGVLAAVGGLEIAMMAGVVLGAARHGVPVVTDGYIAGSAVLAATALCPEALDYVVFSHRSAEPGHDYMYSFLGAEPLLSLDLRLGEGTGAVLAIPMIDGACRVLANMLTFEEAGIG